MIKLNKISIQRDFLLLILAIVLIFLVINRITSWESFGSIPLGGDTNQVLAIVKAFSDGDIFPFGPKFVQHLGAPFSANWHDFPFEDLLWVVPGWLAIPLGLPHALMLFFLLISIAAGVSFYWVGRELEYKIEWRFTTAILFAFTPYLFARNFSHMNLASYWHIPLLLYVLVKCSNSLNTPIRSVSTLCVFAAIGGVLSVYYLYPFLFILIFIGICHLRDKNFHLLKVTFFVAASAFGAFVVQHLDSLYFIWKYGSNDGALVRGLDGLARWGLRFDDLIFPYDHRLIFFRKLTDFHNARVLPEFIGEGQVAYIGIVAIFSLVALTVLGISGLFGNGKSRVFWFSLLLPILLLGLVGGLNFLFGNFGLLLFRATNRFSIYITAIALFFLCENLSKYKIRKNYSIPLSMILCIVGLLDQVPASYRLDVKSYLINWNDDKIFSEILETSLPKKSMIFQLPVVKYPEAGHKEGMTDYEHFRPYFHTKDLRYSYGSVKGRDDTAWQLQVENLPVSEMIEKLESYGFGGLVINKSGYRDNGDDLISKIVSLGLKEVSRKGDLIAYKINPSLAPVLPKFKIKEKYKNGFFNEESDSLNTWRWSLPNSTIVVKNPFLTNEAEKFQKQVIFSLEGIKKGNVFISVDDQPEVLALTSNQSRAKIILDLKNDQNVNVINFRSDIPAVRPGNGDLRALSFRVLDFVVQ